jgi:hypothetical protein
MGVACSTPGRAKKCIKKFSRKTWREHNFRVFGVNGRIILKWRLRKKGVRVWTGLNWLMAESTYVLSIRQWIFGFHKRQVFLDHLSKYQLLKNSAAWVKSQRKPTVLCLESGTTFIVTVRLLLLLFQQQSHCTSIRAWLLQLVNLNECGKK